MLQGWTAGFFETLEVGRSEAALHGDAAAALATAYSNGRHNERLSQKLDQSSNPSFPRSRSGLRHSPSWRPASPR